MIGMRTDLRRSKSASSSADYLAAKLA